MTRKNVVLGFPSLSINASTASFPGKRFTDAATGLLSSVEPLWGQLSLSHMQLCPQNYGELGEPVIEKLFKMHPGTEFRLHANVRVPGGNRKGVSLSSNSPEYYKALKVINDFLLAEGRGGEVYSAHAGLKREATLDQMRVNCLSLEDLLGVPVAVEGMYPSTYKYLLSNWNEYRWLLDSDLNYAIDLSHVNILASKTRKKEESLLLELLSSPRCLEVHVSDNDGKNDKHLRLSAAPWWMGLLMKSKTAAVIFSEARDPSIISRKESA